MNLLFARCCVLKIATSLSWLTALLSSFCLTAWQSYPPTSRILPGSKTQKYLLRADGFGMVHKMSPDQGTHGSFSIASHKAGLQKLPTVRFLLN